MAHQCLINKSFEATDGLRLPYIFMVASNLIIATSCANMTVTLDKHVSWECCSVFKKESDTDFSPYIVFLFFFHLYAED